MRKTMSLFDSSALCALLLVMSCLSGRAQTITGTIVGTVTDPSGSTIAGADVTLTHTTTRAQRKTKTLGAGDFVLIALEPAEYNPSVTSAGFKASAQAGVNRH